MAERLIAPVLKTGIVLNKELSRVRIPLSPFFARRIDFFIGFARPKGGMARLGGIAEPEKIDSI